MKKTKFCLLSLSLVAMLASCGGSKTQNPSYRIATKDSILTEEILKANAHKNEEYSVDKKVSLKDTSIAPMGEGLSLVSANYQYGYAIYAKDYGDVDNERRGIYSLFGNAYLIEPRLKVGDYQIDNDMNAGFRVIYKDVNDRYYLIDGYGNKLYESDNEFEVTNSIYPEIDDELFISLEINEGGVRTNYLFKLDENYKATKIDELPKGKDYEHYKEYSIGDSIIEKVDLKDFGLDRYYVKNNEGGYYFDIYNSKDNSFVNRIEIPSTANNKYFVVGTNVFYQTAIDVTKDGTEYNFATPLYEANYYETQKYMVRTYKASLKDGSVEEIETECVINDAEPLKDEKGIERYARVELFELTKEKAMGAQRVLIMDQDGKFHDDITNKNIDVYTLLSNGNYYNTYNDTLYDKNFNILAKGEDFNSKAEVIYTSLHNGVSPEFYVMNNEGKVIIAQKNYANSYKMLANNVIAIQTTDLRYHFYDVTDGKPVSVDELYFKTTDVNTPVVTDLTGVYVREVESEDEDYVPVTTLHLLIPGGNALSILCYNKTAETKFQRNYDGAQFKVYTVENKDASFTTHLISTGNFSVTTIPTPNVA